MYFFSRIASLLSLRNSVVSLLLAIRLLCAHIGRGMVGIPGMPMPRPAPGIAMLGMPMFGMVGMPSRWATIPNSDVAQPETEFKGIFIVK